MENIMKLQSNSFLDHHPIPGDFAFCVKDSQNHVRTSANRNPHMAWSDVPEGTRSLVLICHDPDVPSKGDDVNKEERTIPAELPRVDFFHWALVDIPVHTIEIGEGAHSNGITPRGKAASCPAGEMRHGINDYTSWFKSDKDMEGNYFGYDGPCPPWNDPLMHHYVFTIYALDISRLDGLKVNFTGAEALKAIQGHVLGSASLTGVYTLNPTL